MVYYKCNSSSDYQSELQTDCQDKFQKDLDLFLKKRDESRSKIPSDFQSELQTDLNFYVETMFLWTDVEAAWDFDKEFSVKFEAWLKKKTIETAEALMEINP